MRVRWSDLAYVVIGGTIGYQIQVASVVEGTSMAPTLASRQRLLHAPMWSLGWWCWPFLQVATAGRLLVGSDARQGTEGAPPASASSVLRDSLAWRGHTSPRVGDVVLAVVDDKGTTVCKRVVGISDDYDGTVLGEWEGKRFRANEAEEDVMEGFDEGAYRWEEEDDGDREEVLRQAVLDDEAEYAEELATAAPSSPSSSADTGAGLGEDLASAHLPDVPTPEHMAALHQKLSQPLSLNAVSPFDEPHSPATGAQHQHQQLPRRSKEWDMCRLKGLAAMGRGDAAGAEGSTAAQGSPVRWLWLEGDNPSNSFDSRHTGAIPEVCLKGLVVAVWWPLQDIKLI